MKRPCTYCKRPIRWGDSASRLKLELCFDCTAARNNTRRKRLLTELGERRAKQRHDTP